MSKLNCYPLATALGVAALLGSVVAAVPAHAGGGDFIEEDGACSGSSIWMMKAKHDDGRIELEFQVDTDRAGQTWTVRVVDNGSLVFAGQRITNRFSRFHVDRRPANRAGTDHFRARARNARTGEVCRGFVDLGQVGSSGGSG